VATDIETQLRQMTAEMDVPPAAIDTSRLLPVFAPAAFFATGKWCGPYTRLRTPDLGLTWAVLLPDTVMRYVNQEMQAHWESAGLDWKALAMRNLARETNERSGAHTLCRPGGQVYAIAFMYEDGLGTSRLLLRHGLEKLFPKGYRVALPERSCGFAYAAYLTDKESRLVRETVDNCFHEGAYPLVSGSFAPDDLLPV
jgi:hypothetical protein